jgi:hypothetical protein
MKPSIRAARQRRDSSPQTLAMAALACILVSGCASAPLQSAAMVDPNLAEIQTAFEKTVRQAHTHTDVVWLSGWSGNAWVNMAGGSNYGLCYQWRDLVYAGVLPTVRHTGWAAKGIVINQGTVNEHHAVVVFDPQRLPLEKLLSATAQQPAYVLDAWRRGRADIYALHTWLQLPLFLRSPAQLRTLAEPLATAHPGGPVTLSGPDTRAVGSRRNN